MVEIFNDSEEKNLFLIQMTQDAEQNLEELKTAYKKNKIELEHKSQTLLLNREQLRRQFDDVQAKIKQLTKSDESKATNKDDKELRKNVNKN